MGQNPERTGLGGASPRSPVFCVLNKSLFAGVIGEEGRQAHQPERVPTNTDKGTQPGLHQNGQLPGTHTHCTKQGAEDGSIQKLATGRQPWFHNSEGQNK